MQRWIVTAVLLAFFGVGGLALASDGKGVSCNLLIGGEKANPGQMLMFLHERDAELGDWTPGFMNTVEYYDFGTVGNLIAEKCEAP